MADPDNHAVAEVFAEMAELLDILGGDRYRARTFGRVSRLIADLEVPVRTALDTGVLGRRRGVGEGTLTRLREILRSGTCQERERLRARLPPGVRELLAVRGLGPRTVRLLYTYLRIGSIAELEQAARAGKLSRVPRLGERAAERILAAIAQHRRRPERLPLAAALRLGAELVESVRGEGVERIALTGSARRFRDTVGDLDLLVASRDPVRVTSRFLTLPRITDVLVRGEGRTSVLIDGGQQVDLRIVVPESYGAGLHYFTGSKAHNIAIRVRGNRRRLKISEHGVFRRADEARLLAGAHEEEIFAAVGLPFIPPELRENEGEIEAAERGQLPRLIELGDLRGDLHVHTTAGDGAATPRAMAEAARALGLGYLAITDPAGRARPRRAGDELGAQAEHLRRLGDELGIHLLCGAEVAIGPGGELELEIERLAELDWVVAVVEDHLDQSAEQMTARLVTAMESGVVDCIGHPLGRLLGERGPVALDRHRLLAAAARLEVALELSSDPRRLDLDALGCREAKTLGARVVISSAARDPHQLAQRALGVCVARRGWLEPADVLNCRPAVDLLARRRDRLCRHAVAVPAPLPPPAATDPDGQAAAVGDEATALAITLTVAPLAESLAERLHAWLRDGRDPPLQAALATLSPNPVQKAFELLLTAARRPPP